jgi:pimeloyl-ACP methyl ester carboxylesterase
MSVASLTVELADVTLHCATFGPEDGPLALCLHGFPDTWHTFRYLAPHLAARGFHVVTPAMRGYAPSSVSATGNYQIAALASDAAQLHERLGGDERAVLIGHDWGAVATYPAITAEPQRWRRAVTMSVPPLLSVATSFTTFAQLHSSWYVFLFQSPLADTVVELDDMDFIARLMAQWSPGFDFTEDLAHVREALTNKENRQAALGYYRAMFDTALIDATLERFETSRTQLPSVPSLYVHGENDGCFLTSSLADPLDYLAPGSRLVMVENAGHFVHLEQPEEVHRAIDAFLAGR